MSSRDDYPMLFDIAAHPGAYSMSDDIGDEAGTALAEIDELREANERLRQANLRLGALFQGSGR